MNSLARCTILPAALCLVALTGVGRAEEEEIAFDRLPKAVIKTVKAKFPKAEIKEAVEEEGEDGETTYEVALEFKGHAFDVTLSPKGSIVEVEKAIEVDELPSAVKKALAARHPGAKIEKAEMVTKGGGPAYYEVHLTTEVAFTSKGKLIDADESEESYEKPSAKAKKSRKEREGEDEDDERSRSKAKKSRTAEKEGDEDDDERPAGRMKKSTKGENHTDKHRAKADDDDHKKPSAKTKKSKKKDVDDDDDEMKDNDDDKKSSAKAKKSKKGGKDDDDDDDRA